MLPTVVSPRLALSLRHMYLAGTLLSLSLSEARSQHVCCTGSYCLFAWLSSHTPGACAVHATRFGTRAPVGAQIVLGDLAGSERLAKSGSRGIALREAVHINRSLSYLEQARFINVLHLVVFTVSACQQGYMPSVTVCTRDGPCSTAPCSHPRAGRFGCERTRPAACAVQGDGADARAARRAGRRLPHHARRLRLGLARACRRDACNLPVGTCCIPINPAPARSPGSLFDITHSLCCALEAAKEPERHAACLMSRCKHSRSGMSSCSCADSAHNAGGRSFAARMRGVAVHAVMNAGRQGTAATAARLQREVDWLRRELARRDAVTSREGPEGGGQDRMPRPGGALNTSAADDHASPNGSAGTKDGAAAGPRTRGRSEHAEAAAGQRGRLAPDAGSSAEAQRQLLDFYAERGGGNAASEQRSSCGSPGQLIFGDARHLQQLLLAARARPAVPAQAAVRADWGAAHPATADGSTAASLQGRNMLARRSCSSNAAVSVI